MTACVIVPARFSSSRYPGKPLVPILGKPLVLWVADLSAKAVGTENVYIATEDVRIAEVVREAGFRPLMTSLDALTGTDRLAEACEMIDYDIYVNVQGDEPLVSPDDIVRCIRHKEASPDKIINGFCWMETDEDPCSRNIPKVVASENSTMVYMSRCPLPGYKDEAHAPTRFMKQVCIYAFNRDELRAFKAYGRKSYLESCEDIEILRFLELGRDVQLFETRPGSIAVDVPEDVAKVEGALRGCVAV